MRINEKEKIGPVNNVLFKVFDKDGFLVHQRRIHNVDVAVGRRYIAGALGGVNPLGVAVIATSTNSTAITDADEGLGAGIEDNAVPVFSYVTTTTTEDTARFIATINYPGGRTVQKAGLQMPGSFKIIVASLIAPAIVVPPGGALTITWDVQIT